MDAPAFEFDFFISRRGSVAAVAQEVADILAAEGFQVRVQDYDFAASGQFVRDIDHALKQARHLLILYSHDYHSSFWTQQEFHNFLAAVAASNGERRIGVLRCDDAIPTGLLYSATFGNLVGVANTDERRRIVLQVARGEAPAVRPSPRIFGGSMPLENLLFTGRNELLAAMHAALAAEDGAAALTQAAVHGLGGVGKTSLARAYVARHGGDYAGVWWVTAADRPGTLAGLASLAHELNPRLPADLPPEDAAREVLRALAARQAPFLLVYDNAPDPATLAGLLPQRGARVLITSRHPDWAGQAHELRVAELPEDQAADLLQRRAGRQDSAGARLLARELGCLPLALDQAGAYVKQTLSSFASYAQLVVALIHRPGGNPDYPASVGATFALAIEAAARVASGAEAVLGRLAWFAPDGIPLLLLDDAIAPEPERAEALAALVHLSLVTPAADTAAGPAVNVHRLVQMVARHRLADPGTAEATPERALSRLAEVFPYAFNDAEPWPVCRALLPHVRAIDERLDPDQAAADRALLNLAGSFLQGSGDAAGALPLYHRALQSRERVLGPEHPDTLTSVNNLAGCMQALGDAAGALPLYRRALESCERVLGREHPDTLTSVNDLALCMQALGDAAGALPLYRRALEGYERVLGPEHPHTLTGVNNLAECMRALGDAAGALPFYRRALDSRERVLGPEHPDTLTSVNNLAECMRALGDAAGALPLYRRALDSRERVLGPEHPATLTSVNNLAGCMRALGDAAGALPLHRRALESRERVLGPEHPDTLTSVNNLALCMQALGDAAGALPLYRRALESRERVLGPEHPNTLTSVNNLALCMQALGDAAGALPLYRRALEGCERVLGPEHPTTRTIAANLEALVAAKGDANDT
ncbi:MAG TPA: FxSxx-COOH system tetratricopeptide repeat protein [Acetobacteraceae bacterium]|nr:FxSxx-COOH system tetratricopeptide repeat protein [Acetobacteraceae bacterium]